MSRWVNRFRFSDKHSPHTGAREIRPAPVASGEDIFAIIAAPLPLPSRSESSDQSYQIFVAAAVALEDVVPSACFCNRRPGRSFRWRRRRRYVLFDQVPKHYREQERDQLRAPVLQG